MIRPSVGGASGRWSQPEIWVSFSSFSYPSTTFKYHFDSNELEVYRKFPVEVDVEGVTATQVWYPSKDGTQVSMFVVHKEGIELDGNNPTLLYGYGGFDVSMRPRFSTGALTWLEAGGVYCVANLRNAMDGTAVEAVWFYLTAEGPRQEIARTGDHTAPGHHVHGVVDGVAHQFFEADEGIAELFHRKSVPGGKSDRFHSSPD